MLSLGCLAKELLKGVLVVCSFCSRCDWAFSEQRRKGKQLSHTLMPKCLRAL